MRSVHRCLILSLSFLTLLSVGCGSDYKSSANGNSQLGAPIDPKLQLLFSQALSLRETATPTTKSAVGGTSWKLLGTQEMLMTTDGSGNLLTEYLNGGVVLKIEPFRQIPCPAGTVCPALVIEQAALKFISSCQTVTAELSFAESFSTTGELRQNFAPFSASALNLACLWRPDQALVSFFGYSYQQGLGMVAATAGQYLYLIDGSQTFMFVRE